MSAKHKKTEQVEHSVEETEIIEEEALLGDKIKSLKNKLKECSDEKRVLLEDLQRARADYLNSKQRLEKEQKLKEQRHTASHIERLLPLCDSFEQAMGDQDGFKKLDQVWQNGIENIYKQLQSLISSYGIKAIEPKGEKFDPSHHEAIAMVAVDTESEHGLVMSTAQKGYLMTDSTHGDTLIRPARVTVGEFTKNN
jgi:molecular chaperone GrpE